MEALYIVVSDSLYKSFTDEGEARDYAAKSAKQNRCTSRCAASDANLPRKAGKQYAAISDQGAGTSKEGTN